jgi:hypothetical protein
MMEPDDNHAGVVTPVGNKKKNAEDGDGSRKKKMICKVHPLPLKFALLTDCDQDKFNLMLEIDKTYKSAKYRQEFFGCQISEHSLYKRQY